MKPTYSIYETAASLKLFEGMTLKVLLTVTDTEGLQAVFEDIVEPGVGPARHIHLEQDETFIFLEGTFDVEMDGQLFRMSAGDTAFIPKGTIHAWKNVGEGTGRLRYVFSPALNIEQMFQDLHDAHESGETSEEATRILMSRYPEQKMAGPTL